MTVEMEHINENTIRVVIENSDLEKRGITFLDLLGNQKQIESFFYSILEEVDVEEEFQETDAVTFQVMPNKNGLELFISKGSNLKQNFFEGHDIDFGEDEFEDFARNKNFDRYHGSSQEDDEEVSNEFALHFDTFEDIISLARVCRLDSGISHLYHYKDNYYLLLVQSKDEMIEKTMEEERAIALEFGNKSSVAKDVLEEHGNQLINSNALESIRHYFK